MTFLDFEIGLSWTSRIILDVWSDTIFTSLAVTVMESKTFIKEIGHLWLLLTPWLSLGFSNFLLVWSWVPNIRYWLLTFYQLDLTHQVEEMKSFAEEGFWIGAFAAAEFFLLCLSNFSTEIFHCSKTQQTTSKCKIQDCKS